MRTAGTVFAGLIAVILMALALTSCGTIQSGNVGVRTTLGKVTLDEMEPGVYAKLPLISLVQENAALVYKGSAGLGESDPVRGAVEQGCTDLLLERMDLTG